MTMSSAISFPISIGRAVVLGILFAVYGAATILRGVGRLCHRTSVTLRLLSRSLVCPACGEPCSTVGRFQCASCSAVYAGAVVLCGYCGARASHYPCARCGAAITIEPWVDP
jgi:hypothetical protein